MSNPSSKPKRDKREESPQKITSSQSPAPVENAAEPSSAAKPIAILREREIPFEEERPPNFSPHFQIRVHRVRQRDKPQEAER